MSPKPLKLIEGVDYYMEGDRFVFTATYHLKRGYCCNSKCRHCPFKKGEPVALEPIRLVLPLRPPRLKDS